jgi:hypothetical protein
MITSQASYQRPWGDVAAKSCHLRIVLPIHPLQCFLTERTESSLYPATSTTMLMTLKLTMDNLLYIRNEYFIKSNYLTDQYLSNVPVFYINVTDSHGKMASEVTIALLNWSSSPTLKFFSWCEFGLRTLIVFRNVLKHISRICFNNIISSSPTYSKTSFGTSRLVLSMKLHKYAKCAEAYFNYFLSHWVLTSNLHVSVLSCAEIHSLAPWSQISATNITHLRLLAKIHTHTKFKELKQHKTIPVTDLGASYGYEIPEISYFLVSRNTDDCEIIRLTLRSLLTPMNIPGSNFCQRLRVRGSHSGRKY